MSDTFPELTIGKPVHGGYCLAHDASGTLFVAGALPGERVRVRVTRQRKRVRWAEVVDVLEPSPDRREHVDPAGAGGADLGHVCLAASRAWKAEVIADALRRVGSPALAEAAGPVSVQAAPGDVERDGLAWRTRVELTVTPDLQAGMHLPGTDRIVACDALPLAVPEIEALGLLGPDSQWRDLWRPGERVRAWGEAVRIGAQWYSQDRTPIDEPTLQREVSGDVYRVRAGDFWQAHRAGPAVLRGEVERAAAGFTDRPVAEAYCGSGLFTLPLARMATAGVLAAEGSASACQQADANTAAVGGVEIWSARIGARFVADTFAPARPGLIVLDPPRAGAGQATTRALAACGARRIVLVACDPAALARDGEVLRTHGYAITKLACHDLFPYTHHVECVAVWDRDT